MLEKIFKNDIGIVSFMAYPDIASKSNQIVKSVYKIISDPFFSVIEITHIEDKEIREEVKKMLEVANMRVIFGAHPITFSDKLNINSEDQNERLRSLKKLKELISEAYFMNSESFVFVSGPKPVEGKNEKISFENLKSSVKELCEFNNFRAKEICRKPMNMILETFDDKIFAKNRFVGPTKIAVELSKYISAKYSNFGLLMDLSHLPILDEDFEVSLKESARFIKHVHIGNCILKDKNHKAYGDEHPRFCVDNGEIYTDNLANFIKILNEIGYLDNFNNAISFEVKPLAGEDADLTIAGSKRVLLRALKKLD